MKKLGLGILLLTAVLAYLWPRSSNPPPAAVQSEEVTQSTPAIEAIEPSSADPVPVKSAAPDTPVPQIQPPSPFAEKLEQVKFPSIEQVRKEVEANPHSTPIAVLSGTDGLNQALRAVASTEDAEQLMVFLGQCSAQESTQYITIKTMCLRNAKLLSDRYPELRDDYGRVRANAPEEARNISDRLGKF